MCLVPVLLVSPQDIGQYFITCAEACNRVVFERLHCTF